MTSACVGTSEGSAQGVAEDFRIVYRVHSGPLPPPSQYTYTITLESNGSVDVQYEGDGGSWSEQTTISADTMALIWEGAFSADVIGRTWEPADEAPMGGNAARLSFRAYGHEVHVDQHLSETNDRQVFQAVEAIVHGLLLSPAAFDRLPGTVRARFETRRQELRGDPPPV